MFTQKLVDHLYGDPKQKTLLQKSLKRKKLAFGVLLGSYLGYKLGFYFSNR